MLVFKKLNMKLTMKNICSSTFPPNNWKEQELGHECSETAGSSPNHRGSEWSRIRLNSQCPWLDTDWLTINNEDTTNDLHFVSLSEICGFLSKTSVPKRPPCLSHVSRWERFLEPLPQKIRSPWESLMPSTLLNPHRCNGRYANSPCHGFSTFWLRSSVIPPAGPQGK